MTWSGVLNVALGLTFVYLVFSIAASRINEVVATALQWRARGLERGLCMLLGNGKPPRDGKPPTKGLTRLVLLARRLLSGVPGRGPRGDEQDAPTEVELPVDAVHSPGAPADGTLVQSTAASLMQPVASRVSADAMKGHPIVTAFDSAVGKNRRISYLPARAFSAVVLDLLAPPAATLADAIMEDPASALTPDSETALEALRVHPDTQHVDEFAGTLAADSPLRREALPRLRAAVSDDVMDRARATVEQLPRWHPARRPLLRMLADAADERELFRAKLEHWYDDAMDRLSGWYKRRVQRAILVYAAVLTLCFNVDSVNMVETLWRSPVEQVAAAQAAATAAGTDLSTIDTSLSRLEGLAVPIGWDLASSGNPDANRRGMPADRGQWFLKVLGLGLTVVALGFGAPFWFDVLGKVARVRDTGPRPARDGTPAL